MRQPYEVYSGRFALLRHVAPHVGNHWDLLLESSGDQLLAWRIEKLPDPSDCRNPSPELHVTAIRIKNHRPKYLDYEGPIDGNRGHVARQFSGNYAAALVILQPNDLLDEAALRNAIDSALPGQHLIPSELFEDLGNDQRQKRLFVRLGSIPEQCEFFLDANSEGVAIDVPILKWGKQLVP